MVVRRIEWINDVKYILGSNTFTTSYDLHLIPGAEITPSLLKIYESDSSWKWASQITSDDNVTVQFNPRIFPPLRGASSIVGMEYATRRGYWVTAHK